MDNIIESLSIKYNLSEEIVTKIIRSQFLFVKDTMENPEDQSVELRFLGKFAIKPNRVRLLNEKFKQIESKI